MSLDRFFMEIVGSRTPENWQNGAETEGRMRRAQLIGLAGIVVASGLWATPAVGQTSGPWVVWAVCNE